MFTKWGSIPLTSMFYVIVEYYNITLNHTLTLTENVLLLYIKKPYTIQIRTP